MLRENYFFDSQIFLGEKLKRSFSVLEIKNEPMLFSCDKETAFRLGGPLTHEFLKSLNEEFLSSKDLIIDSRVHMLMKDWYPAIPGFHHDDVPRGIDGQPNYDNPEYLSKHAMCLVNGDICPTQFALGKCELSKVEEGEVIYKHWHDEVVNLLAKRKLDSWSAVTDQVIYFDWQAIHQAVKAVSPGWRWFVRATINTDRKPTNELRRQVQVYLEDPTQGW